MPAGTTIHFAAMSRAAVMFDLDGTLADTLTDIARCANAALQARGHAPHPREAYRFFAGQGVHRLFTDALGLEHDTDVTPLVEAFKSRYAEAAYDHTGPYDGVPELLDALTGRGVTLAVLSNKPDAATRLMVGRLFGRWDFAAVRGQRDGIPVKPDPTAARAIAAALGLPPERWIYVGDTAADMLTGTRSGFLTVGVTWGFRDEAELRDHGADAIIHRPLELLALLDDTPA